MLSYFWGLAQFLFGFTASLYLTNWFNLTEDNHLIIAQQFHIHHWNWSLLEALLIAGSFCFPKLKNFFRVAFIVVVAAIGLAHRFQGHLLVGQLFLISAWMIFCAFHVSTEEQRVKIFNFLLLLVLGIFVEGFTTGLYEWLIHGDKSAFQFFLQSKKFP